MGRAECRLADEYDEDLHELIEELLWQSAVQRNKPTFDDKDKGQQRPGIVSLDGVIIDGNRRAMLLRPLEKATGKKQHFDAIILPHAYADNQEAIVRLETQYQLGKMRRSNMERCRNICMSGGFTSISGFPRTKSTN